MTSIAIDPNWPPVTLDYYERMRIMRLGTDWTQGMMHLDYPNDLVMDYAPCMMGWLLLTEPATWPTHHAMQLGLGAGSLTKFCRKRFGMKTTAIDINPNVIEACRRWFKLPKNDRKLQVLLGDGGQLIRTPEWRSTVDGLQVDMYDYMAAKPIFDSQAFYRDCRRLLTPTGSMMVNMYGRSSNFDRTVQRIAAVFGKQAVWLFEPTQTHNRIILAQRTPSRPTQRTITTRVKAMEAHYPLRTVGWAKGFRSLVP